MKRERKVNNTEIRILQLDQILNIRMKDKIQQSISGELKKLCKSKSNRGNLKNGLNAWAAGVVPYSAAIVD